jgi:hypothetical protein
VWCRRSVGLAARMRVRHGTELRVAAILILQRRQRGMTSGWRVLLRVTRSSGQAAKGAQARLLLRRVLRLLLLRLALLRLELLALLALLGGMLLLAGFRLELLAI